MKAIRDVHYFQEEGQKNINNQPLAPHTAIVAHVHVAFKISKSSVEAGRSHTERISDVQVTR
jgi:hypothetical protein